MLNEKTAQNLTEALEIMQDFCVKNAALDPSQSLSLKLDVRPLSTLELDCLCCYLDHAKKPDQLYLFKWSEENELAEIDFKWMVLQP